MLTQTTIVMASQAANNTSISRTYQDPTKLSFFSKSEKYCITCGKSEKVNRCTRCKGAWYCDSNCQKADWPCHKILCAKYAKLNKSEPIENGYRAFLFRADSPEPELLLLPVTWKGHRDVDPVRSLLHHEGSRFGQSLQFPGFGFNGRLGTSYIYAGKKFLGIQVACRDTHGFDGSPPNKSIFASVSAIGKKPPHLWAGNIVVQREHDSGTGLRAGSVTMADFRHTIDWLASYGKVQNLSPWYSSNFSSIQGIQINGDQQIKDESERYTTVTVPDSHAIRGLFTKLEGDVSLISERIGRPLRLIMRPTQLRDLDADGRMPTCSPAAALMRSLDKDTNVESPQMAFGLPRGGLPFVGQALVVRADDKDLSLDEVKAMAHFSESTCRGVFQGVTLVPREDKPGMEAAMQKALDFMTWDNYLRAFVELGLPMPQRPVEEAFVDMRGPPVPDDAAGGGEDEDEEWDDDDAWDEDESDD